MDTSEKDSKKCNRFRGVRPETEAKYRQAIELYRSTDLPVAEISRMCGLTNNGLRCYIFKYHRDLMLARNNILCDKEAASKIKLNQLRGQLPASRIKYKDAIEACGSMEYIELNVSQIARQFGLEGSNLGRQLRTHYPGIIEWREKVRTWLGFDDGLPRGSRSFCKEQYAEALKLLRSNSYLTVQEVADTCGLSYTGLEQHLLFYHKELVKRRIKIREKAVRNQRKGEITGRGTVHSPSPKMVQKYAEAVHLFSTTPMSAAQIAKQTDVSKKRLLRTSAKMAPRLDMQTERHSLCRGTARRLVASQEIQSGYQGKIHRSYPSAERKRNTDSSGRCRVRITPRDLPLLLERT